MDFLIRLDRILIGLFKITGSYLLDYFIGLSLLSIISLCLGKITSFVAYKVNRNYLKEYENKMEESMSLAHIAYRKGNKLAYKGLNEEATDYWGRHFFLSAAISISSLWPVPLALYWLSLRFEDVKIPVALPFRLIWKDGIGYLPLFLVLYILTRIAMNYIRKIRCAKR